MKRIDNISGGTLHYTDDISVLESYYENKYKLIKAGNTDLVTLELVMLGNALDFIAFADKTFGIKLNGNESSVAVFDEVLDALCRGIVKENLFSQSGTDIAKKAAAYLGFLIIANIGGEWEDTQDGIALKINGRTAYVEEFITKRLVSGSPLNVEGYYNSIKPVK